ncbi:MAG: hypothetical protein DI534_03055 [Leifsonia xyli]|nr:MAG: hypothetical protein DI534_03055 [Leifsonia xyli]
MLVATRGPQARTVLRELSAITPRPVFVSGMPGISIPATRKALFFRAQADLFVLHARREVREFGALAARNGWHPRLALASLPFAARGIPEPRTPTGTDLVFAVQSIVPLAVDDRRRVARMLLAAAEARPDRRVVVKVRAAAGERQTHDEEHPIPELVAAEAARAGRAVPPNLVVSSVAMSTALDTAEGLVTVSSTAIIEAIARGIPVIALDTFGIDDRLINPVFEGSGLFAGEDAVVGRAFRHPDPGWLDDAYFHPHTDDELVPRLRELVAARRSGGLPARAELPVRGGALRRAWQRRLAFPGHDGGVRGLALDVIGHPLRFGARVLRRVTSLLRTPTRTPVQAARDQTP